MTDPFLETLRAAAVHVGLDATQSDLIRLGENAVYRLPDQIVARVTRPDHHEIARKEIQVARWLNASGIPAVRPVDDLTQPVYIGDRAVTWWHELGPHRPCGRTDLAAVLSRIHALPLPTFELPQVHPFVGLASRIDSVHIYSTEDRKWLHSRLQDLEARYAELPSGLPWCVIHGDAWGGNVVVTDDQIVVLDLERTSFGPPEWDLVSSAVHLGLDWLSLREYQTFVDIYGHDVTEWAGYPILRDIRELRVTLFAAQVADNHPHARDQARHRLACLRGERGLRPWRGWHPVP